MDRPATKSPSDPQAMVHALKPLFAVCGVTFSKELMDGYYVCLKDCDARYVKLAVERHLLTATDRFLPAPAAIARMARMIDHEEWQALVDDSPPCPACQNTGIVDGRENGKAWRLMACACIRGERSRFPRFNPATMQTWKQVQARIAGIGPGSIRKISSTELVAKIGNIPTEDLQYAGTHQVQEQRGEEGEETPWGDERP